MRLRHTCSHHALRFMLNLLLGARKWAFSVLLIALCRAVAASSSAWLS
jgi:hypothetical protein